MRKIVTVLFICIQLMVSTTSLVFAETKDSTTTQSEVVNSTEGSSIAEKSSNQVESTEETTEMNSNVETTKETKLNVDTEKTEESENKDLHKNIDSEVVKKNIVVIPRGDVMKDRDEEGRYFAHSALERTGIFLPRGQQIKVVLEEEPEQIDLVIGQYGSYKNLDSVQESSNPVSYALVKGENIITRSDSDGMVYLENKSDSQTVTVSIEGGIEIPSYVLGDKESSENFSKKIDELKMTVPFFELEGKYVFGTFQMSQIEYLDYKNDQRLVELLNYWDKLVTLSNEAYGFNNEAGYTAAKNMNQRIHITNPDTGIGYASTGDKRMIFQVDSGASKDMLSNSSKVEQWGLWHEIGHTYQSPYYTFDGMTEIAVNISANYISEKLGFGDRTAKGKEMISEYLNRDRTEKNFYDLEDGELVKLSALWTLQRVFGNDFFATLAQAYRSTPINELFMDNTDAQAQQMIRMMSQISNRNLADYFDQWGLTPSEETWNFCKKLPSLEKEIWLDIPGYDNRYTLDGVLPKYTVPTASSINQSVRIFEQGIQIKNAGSVPVASKLIGQEVKYLDIGSTGGAVVKITNENNVSNLIPITGEITGGDAVKIRGNRSAYRIIAPVPETKTFSVTGAGTNLHGGSWRDQEYVSITQYNSSLTAIKKQVVVNGIGTNSDSAEIQNVFNNQKYEIGDYIRINHVESHIRLDRYKNDELLEKDKNHVYWYIMTDNGWSETTPDLGVVGKNVKVTLGQKLKAEDLVEIPEELRSKIAKIEFKEAPNLSNVGSQSAKVSITTDLGVEQIVSIKEIQVTGGDAIKIRGNRSAYRIIAPDPETKTFSVAGTGTNLHGGFTNQEYVSITQYDYSLASVKKQVVVNGSGTNSDSTEIQKVFNNQKYEIGDYIKVNHVESHTRLDRYRNDELMEKDKNKIYWYVMSKNGWEMLDAEPEGDGITLDTYYYGAINITGTFSGDIKRGKLVINDKVISQGGTFQNGKFSYYVGAGRITQGNKVSIEFINSKNEVVTSSSVNSEAFPTVGKIISPKYILGTNEIRTAFEGTLKYARLVVDGMPISVGGTIIDENTLSYYVNPTKIKNDSQVMMQGYDKNDNPVGELTKVDVLPFDGKLTKVTYKLNEQWIKGTFEGNVKKARLTIDGQVISSGGTFNKNGTFQYYVNPSAVKLGKQVYLEIYDDADRIISNQKYSVDIH